MTEKNQLLNKADYINSALDSLAVGTFKQLQFMNVEALLVVEDGKGGWDTYSSFPDSSPRGLALIERLADCRTVDEAIKKIVLDAKANGHDSTFLTSLGIPSRPSEEI